MFVFQIAEGAESFLNPPVVHGSIKLLLGAAGTLAGFLGFATTIKYSSYQCSSGAFLKSGTRLDPEVFFNSTTLDSLILKGEISAITFTWGQDPMCESLGPEMGIFWLLSAVLLMGTSLLGKKWGRKFTVGLTNILSKPIGVKYVMHSVTMVVQPHHVPTPGLRGEPGRLGFVGRILTGIANLNAQFNALTDPEYQKDLRNLGHWKKKDTFSMFYSSFNHNGVTWAMFLMFKNIMVGTLLTTCDLSMCSRPCPCGKSAE